MNKNEDSNTCYCKEHIFNRLWSKGGSREQRDLSILHCDLK